MVSMTYPQKIPLFVKMDVQNPNSRKTKFLSVRSRKFNPFCRLGAWCSQKAFERHLNLGAFHEILGSRHCLRAEF